MKLNKNVIAFRKGIIVPPNDYADNRIDVATCNAELMRFGYMLTQEAFEQLAKADTAFIHELTTQLSQHLTEMTGDGTWKPLHAGFPETVMAMSIAERYMHNILGYWTNGKYYPDQEVKDAGYNYDYVEFKMIGVGTENEFGLIFKSLTLVNNSLAPGDMQTIEWFADNYSYEELKKFMPESIPFKENLAVLAAKGLPVPVKTPSDVLRIAHYLSHGHTDLLIPPLNIRVIRKWQKNPDRLSRAFKSFSRPQRRVLMGLLEECAYPAEMVRNYAQWIRLGEKLHPGEFVEKYPQASKAFLKLRNTKVKSWYGQLDTAFKTSLDAGLAKLSERPGEFARRVDAVYRKANLASKPDVLAAFRKVAVNVSGKVLWELYEHFKGRNVQKPRSVWIKGDRKPTVLKTLSPMKQEDIDLFTETIWGVFFDKFKLLSSLGAVWLDEKLKNIPAPTNMRSLSEGLITVVRGQRNKIIADKKVLRCYIHWTAGTDLDLSMELYSKKDNKVGSFGFHSYSEQGLYSSGDLIPHNEGKHAEYVDIVLDTVKYDYALMMVNSYGGRPLNETGLIAGFMERDTHESGNKTWYPATITQAVKITTSARRACLVLIDLKTREWMLVDQDTAGVPVSNGSKIAGIVQQIAELPEISAYHILKLHAEARGKIVAEKEQADTLFEFKDFSTSYEKLLEYML